MSDPRVHCHPEDHDGATAPLAEVSLPALERAASLFRALGDAPRLRILQILTHGERCVTEIVERLGEKFSTVSQRLRVLRSEGLVVRRRDRTHLFYALADSHVVHLLRNALEHAVELETTPPGLSGSDD